MADFGILQPTPNFAQAVLGGYQAGQQIAKQRRLDSALSGVDLEKPETILPLLRIDPATGAALVGASAKLADARRESEGRAALGNYLSALQPGQTPHAGAVQALMPGAPDIGASGVPSAAGAQSPPTDQNEITVTAKPTASQPPADAVAIARQHLIETDPKTFLDIQDNLSKMDEAQRKKTDEATSAFAAVGQNAAKLPYEQRRAYIQSQASYLAGHGVTADHITGFDPTDQNLFSEVGKALGVKGILEQQDKDRNFNLAQNRASEDARHNRASEGVAAGALGVAKSREAREAKKATQSASDLSGSTTDALLAAAGLR